MELSNDLNRELIRGEDRPQEDYSVTDGNIRCYFKNLEFALIQHIREADVVLGCVAWLTNFKVLQALSEKRAVSIIINKEDFLRPDTNAGNDFTERLKRSYEIMPGGITRFFTNFKINKKSVNLTVLGLSCCSDYSISPIRVMGLCTSEKSRTLPRNHHKFVLFCKSSPSQKYGTSINIIEPYAVWTGSYNFTLNAEKSFENALYITNKNIVTAYLMEWGQVAALSEPLDWFSNYVEPEWRIGT